MPTEYSINICHYYPCGRLHCPKLMTPVHPIHVFFVQCDIVILPLRNGVCVLSPWSDPEWLLKLSDKCDTALPSHLGTIALGNQLLCHEKAKQPRGQAPVVVSATARGPSQQSASTARQVSEWGFGLFQPQPLPHPIWCQAEQWHAVPTEPLPTAN